MLFLYVHLYSNDVHFSLSNSPRQGFALFNLERYSEAKASFLKGLELDRANEVLKEGLREIEIFLQGRNFKISAVLFRIHCNNLHVSCVDVLFCFTPGSASSLTGDEMSAKRDTNHKNVFLMNSPQSLVLLIFVFKQFFVI